MSADFQDLIDRLAAAATDAREAVREAHAATKDLRREVAEARQTVRDLMSSEWDLQYRELLRAEMEGLNRAIRRAQDQKLRQVIASFDKMTNLLIYGNEQGRGTTFAVGSAIDPAVRRLAAEAKAPLEVEDAPPNG